MLNENGKQINTGPFLVMLLCVFLAFIGFGYMHESNSPNDAIAVEDYKISNENGATFVEVEPSEVVEKPKDHLTKALSKKISKS